jgi:tetratricopeptide (TPR) repeat protein
LDAFRKAVEAEPDSPLPRRILAFGFMAANRPNDAIKAWQELLKINPEDSEAAYSLGSALLSQKRFADAIPALEASSKAAPENIPRLLTLASAYLRSGNSEKGVATFESALKLSPGPQIENDFGYELADTNIRLSDALQHSQKAVQATEDASSKVTLAKLEADDLSHTRDLSAFWDTLGWVYFRMSNLPRAEQYLSASFDLSQNSTVADHLGQVYEQEQKTEAAIRMYRLALATNSNMPETQARLTRLNHGGTRPQNIVVAEAELSQLRSTKLARIVPGPASAEFFLLFGSGPRLEEVKFINGSQKLRPAEKTLLSSHFKIPFPDGSSAHLVRRGILSCYPTTGCTFVLLLPESVRSVD